MKLRFLEPDPRIGVGDIVTRNGTDLHMVVAMDPPGQGLCMVVICIKEPASDDGMPWITLYETESNLVRRYRLIKKARYIKARTAKYV